MKKNHLRSNQWLRTTLMTFHQPLVMRSTGRSKLKLLRKRRPRRRLRSKKSLRRRRRRPSRLKRIPMPDRSTMSPMTVMMTPLKTPSLM
jgi:hypothetical protein